MNEEIPDDEHGLPLPEPPKQQGGIVNFNADADIDLRPALPSMAELMANGGRLLITHALREMPYAEYLKTNHWQDVRRLAFRTYGRRCTIGVDCSGPMDVHHRTRYRECLGAETADDIEVLCRLHHKMKHETHEQFVRAQLHQQFNRQ